jgi:hypothetical protein
MIHSQKTKFGRDVAHPDESEWAARVPVSVFQHADQRLGAFAQYLFV